MWTFLFFVMWWCLIWLDIEIMNYNLPQDPMMLFSVINMKLRDQYASLDELCEDMNVDKEELIQKLAACGFEYSEENNKFWWLFSLGDTTGCSSVRFSFASSMRRSTRSGRISVIVHAYSVLCISQTVSGSPTAMRRENAIWCASSPVIGITPDARSIASRDRKNLAMV